jgi:hypothetical protein
MPHALPWLQRMNSPICGGSMLISLSPTISKRFFMDIVMTSISSQSKSSDDKEEELGSKRGLKMVDYFGRSDSV